MAAPPAASLVARAALPPRLRPTTASPLGPAVLGPSSRRRYLRLRRSPSLAGTAAAAASSPSVPSSFPGPGPGIGDALGDVEIYSAATGEPVLFRDLWDQDELPFPLEYLYADPDRKAKVFSRFDSLKEAVKNYTIEATPDDRAGVLQQGGMFVFKGKELLYARKDEGTGDHAPLDDVLNICCKVPVT
ncbi:Thioredoxin superfamily protein [Zea mays]|uniref:Thioredoxin superfamily protein n=1 Tax=Zea mays TaxID=4577 RepID=A0A1D6GI98_MAIZE|nr:Thioredoxin superfamily protein [Zea mays]